MCAQDLSDAAIQNFTNVTAIVHERFRKGVSYDYDIALIRLGVELTFNDYVQPVCLPSTSLPADADCIVAGWSFRQRKLTGTLYERFTIYTHFGRRL